jgi:peptidyl-prolyl cis-trans isomerase B (cyclophilin B)
MLRRLLPPLLAALLLGALGAYAASKPATKAKPAETRHAPPTKQQIQAARKAGKVRVKMETAKGTIVLELDGKAAPISVANFENLVNAGFYNGLPFHRVELGFVIQAGDPKLVGRPPVGYTIPDEKSPLKHDQAGLIAMARLGGPGGMVPNSADTQFYITLGPAPHLDGLGFAVFGRVVKGLEVVKKIARGDTIKTAVMEKKPKA